MFIIWGTRVVNSTLTKGSFYCPKCNARRDHKHQQARRFFTLFFIPIIPMKKLGEFVECQTCKSTFDVKVLNYDPERDARQFEAEYQKAVRRVLVHMLLVDGTVDEREVSTAKEIYTHMMGEGTPFDVQAEIDTVRQSRESVISSMEALSGKLNDQGKENIIRAAFFIATADGDFADEEKNLLTTIGSSLGMTPAHVKGVIVSLVEGQQEAQNAHLN